jgi:hypothetical protein
MAATTEHQFYFYIYDANAHVSNPTLEQMLYVGNAHIDKSASDRYAQIADSYNGQLRDFLTRQGLHQFIPLKNPSMDTTKNANGAEVVTICYYHNKIAYNNVYRLYPEYICMPAAPLAEQFETLYYRHGLDGWYDHRSNTLIDEDD